jgi:energy-coupling factor transport system permease protein
MHNQASRNSILDPRIFVLLLLFANTITFFQKNLWVEIGWIVFIAVLMLASARHKMCVQWLLSFCVLLLLQYIILPAAPDMIAMIFVILVNYSIRMFPCLMVGALMIREISLRRFVLAHSIIRLSIQVPGRFYQVYLSFLTTALILGFLKPSSCFYCKTRMVSE